MSTVDTGVMLAAVSVKLDGSPMDQSDLQEVRVQDSLSLPTAFSLAFAPPPPLEEGTDPLAMKVRVEIGMQVEISFQGAHQSQTTKLITGEITALEPRFGNDGVGLIAAGYDYSHRLHGARKTRTFQRQSVADIARKLAGDANLTPKTSGADLQYEFMQQNNETDWEFLQRLASMHDLEVVIRDRELTLRPAGTEDGSPIELEYGAAGGDYAPLRLVSFNPRVSAAQQVQSAEVRAWNPKDKAPIVAREPVEQKGASIGIERSSVIGKFPAGTGTITAADAPVATREEASALARSLASYLGHAFVGAYGSCEGHPDVRAGRTLRLRGLGSKFNGEYRVTSATHVYGGGSGYLTRFEVSGKTIRDLIDLTSSARRNGWGDNLVVGIVTQNQDTGHADRKKMGYVRVKFPGLVENEEGWWARVVGIGAGPERGQMMMPLVNDEVLIGFEGGDPLKPYVLGALWNGRAAPGALLNPTAPNEAPDGSYVLRSDKFVDVAAKDNITIKTDNDMTVEVKGASSETVEKDLTLAVKGGMTQNVDKSLTLDVKQSQTLKAGQSFTLEAGTELTLKCGAAQIKLNKAGQIEIKGTVIQVQGSGQVAIKGATVAIN